VRKTTPIKIFKEQKEEQPEFVQIDNSIPFDLIQFICSNKQSQRYTVEPDNKPKCT